MKFSITFDEIEAFIKAHYDLELELRQVCDYEIRINRAIWVSYKSCQGSRGY